MSRERYTAGYAPNTARNPRRRVVGILCLLAALALVVSSAIGNPFSRNLRVALMDGITPVMDWLATPVTGLKNLIEDKNRLFAAYEENKKLREEADGLRHWQSVAQALKAENDSLRSLAGYQPVEEAKYITARVIGQSPDSLRATLLINAGEEDGVKELQPVIDSYGLIGRVTELGAHTARVLLLTDASSRIPVVAADSRIHAILTGSGEELMQLTFLGPESDKIAIGESIATTEEGGLIPGGIAIGTLFRRDKEGLYVKPMRPLAQSEYVRVIIQK